MTTRRDFLSATSLVVAGTVLIPQVAVGAKFGKPDDKSRFSR